MSETWGRYEVHIELRAFTHIQLEVFHLLICSCLSYIEESDITGDQTYSPEGKYVLSSSA